MFILILYIIQSYQYHQLSMHILIIQKKKKKLQTLNESVITCQSPNKMNTCCTFCKEVASSIIHGLGDCQHLPNAIVCASFMLTNMHPLCLFKNFNCWEKYLQHCQRLQFGHVFIVLSSLAFYVTPLQPFTFAL